MQAENLAITDEKLQELANAFTGLDVNGSGYLEEDEVQDALEIVGFKYARYQVRDIIRLYDIDCNDGKISFKEFQRLYAELLQRDYGFQARRQVQARQGLEGYGANYQHANVDIKHSIRLEEQAAFADWINRNLSSDPHCRPYLPFHVDGRNLYSSCSDGVILCKVINVSVPGTIDERALNVGSPLSVFKKHENITLALNSARAIGCNVVNIGATDIENGVKHLILGLLWQIIKAGLLSDINLTAHTELACLLNDGESLADLRRLSPIDILVRWVNYHMAQAGCHRRIQGFQDDIKDSEVYSYLLYQIAPVDKRKSMHSVQRVQASSDLVQRAETVLQNADLLEARVFVTPKDIVAGNAKLNMAFLANLFNKYPCLETSAHGGMGQNVTEDADIVEETREEKTFRNWMNSVGVTPYVNYLYSDLCDGLIIFQLFDIIHPGIVDWKRVNKEFTKLKRNFQILENCNYAVELGKQSRFSLVGIGGEDLRDGKRTLTLALVWQLMRAYTLAVLTQLAAHNHGRPLDDRAILAWAQQKLSTSGKKSQLRSFQDPGLHDGLVMVDLVDAVYPGSVKSELVARTNSPSDWLQNAKYAISMARKAGATVYALPEDIVEVKAKMVLTMVACLMVLDMSRTANGNGTTKRG